MGVAIRTGGCHCGAVRYRVGGAPLFQLLCECRNCQRLSGTVHSSLMGFPRAALAITGRTVAYEYENDTGGRRQFVFCPVCSCGIHGGNPAEDLLTLVASSLDDPVEFAPTQIIHRADAFPWHAKAARLVLGEEG